ncbi:MAG: hypothetical protein K5696_05125 [Lachnospiraceae bacterium]|nr:hypothetical protein [Lachnospiraceae bacterium]
MTIAEASQIEQDFMDTSSPTEDQEFLYTEALGFLIEETKNPKYMYNLGWHYCTKKRFDLEIKYLEMAAEYNFGPALEELGYMWYYGQHGEKDYKKAFEYFSRGADIAHEEYPRSLWCKYKLADMYHNGYAVEKDEKRYRKIIEEAYEEVKDPQYLNEPFPEIAWRYAGILAGDGDKDKAYSLLEQAKSFLAERISLESFWGYIDTMGRIVNNMYELKPLNKDMFNFYDLFFLANEPGIWEFTYNGKTYRIEATDDEDRAIRFEGRYYRDFSELCQKAAIDGER